MIDCACTDETFCDRHMPRSRSGQDLAKSLGRVAYEAFRTGLREPLHEWPRVTGDYAEAWQAAAEAVVMQTTVDAILLPQGRAVIQAAKAWTDDDDRHPRYAQLLMMAVDALRAAEEGGSDDS